MSYNTRRTGPQQPAQQQAPMGQRRPMVTNNFVAGGQQQSGGQQQQQQRAQQQPAQQQQRAQPAAQQQSSQIQFRQQQQTGKPQTPAQQQYNQQQQAQRAAQMAQQQRQGQVAKTPQPPQTQNYQTQSFVKSEPATPSRQTTPVVPGANPPPPEVSNESMETDDATKRKKPWMKGAGKISKKEKLRRRNLRLSKMLQPKNAVMILNELVKNTQYSVDELGCKVDNNQYKAVVTFEGEDHVGLGRSKNQAKNSAAEAALKFLIKNKQLKMVKNEPSDDPMDGGEGMELTTEDGTAILPWQHVASFALFKLFSSWGEDPMMPVRAAQELLGGVVAAKPLQMTPGTKQEVKPAKQLPGNPELMNPIMLLNQMHPGIQFQEIGKSGNPPNVTFTFGVTVDGQTFSGSGNSKKVAKKIAAFAACHNLYNINYPAEVWSPLS